MSRIVPFTLFSETFNNSIIIAQHYDESAIYSFILISHWESRYYLNSKFKI